MSTPQLTKVIAAIIKAAKDNKSPQSTSLKGYLTISDTSRNGLGEWGHIDLPQSLVHGFYHFLSKAGMPCDKPPDKPHITAITNDEILKLKKKFGSSWRAQAGNGKEFSFRVSGLKQVAPDSWREMDEVWLLECRSLDLEKHRESIGLKALPNRQSFHITVAVRRKGRSYKVKAAAVAVKLLRDKQVIGNM